MTTYRTIIGHTNEDGVVAIAANRLSDRQDLADGLAEYWSNRHQGQEHLELGVMNYIGVQKYNKDLETWDTISEFEF